MEERQEPLASEIYRDLKGEISFKNKLIFLLIGIIVVLVIALAGCNLYHIHQWSQFEAVSVDSQSGPASYVQGENTGGVYFGASSSPSEEGRTSPGS